MSKSPNFDKHYVSSSEKASRALAKIKGTDTKGEQLLRSTLWTLGLRFRKNVRHLPGKPDIVFPTERLVVFCDGDFWHGRNWAKDRRRLKLGPNSPYWVAKIKANMDRDKRYNRELEGLGWVVIRLWDSEIKSNPNEAALKVISHINQIRKR